MTYYVSSGTLNHTHSLNNLEQIFKFTKAMNFCGWIVSLSTFPWLLGAGTSAIVSGCPSAEALFQFAPIAVLLLGLRSLFLK